MKNSTLEQTTLSDDVIEKKSSKIKCKICGREFQKITNTHLKKHGIIFNEYMEQFPNAPSVSEGYRKKMSEANLGKKRSEKTKQKMSESHSGEKHYMYGKHHTEERKQKMRKPLSELHKQHISENHADVSGKNSPMCGKGYLVSGEKNGNWQGGISNLPYCKKFDDDLKERVRDFFDRKCYVCGKTETENGQRLSVHHVNYNKMVCCNDIKPLFVPLCRSCHSKTLKDREYWEEFFTVSLNYLTDGECFLPKKCITEEKGD